MDLFAILHALSCLSLLREGQGRILFIPKTLPLLVSQAPGIRESRTILNGLCWLGWLHTRHGRLVALGFCSVAAREEDLEHQSCLVEAQFILAWTALTWISALPLELPGAPDNGNVYCWALGPWASNVRCFQHITESSLALQLAKTAKTDKTKAWRHFAQQQIAPAGTAGGVMLPVELFLSSINLVCSCDLMLRQQKLAKSLHIYGDNTLELELQPWEGIAREGRLDNV